MFSKVNISLKSLHRSPFWTVMAVAALLAQFAFVAHQLEHHVHDDVDAAAEDCIACKASSIIVDGPTTNTAPMPIGIELGSIIPIGFALSSREGAPNKFQSRAPPKSISV